MNRLLPLEGNVLLPQLFMYGVLPQKTQSIPSIHPLPNADGVIFRAMPLPVSCSPIECVLQQKEWRITGLAAYLPPLLSRGNLLQWTHSRFSAQVVSLGSIRGTCYSRTNQSNVEFFSDNLFNSWSSKLENDSSSVAFVISVLCSWCCATDYYNAQCCRSFTRDFLQCVLSHHTHMASNHSRYCLSLIVFLIKKLQKHERSCGHN